MIELRWVSAIDFGAMYKFERTFGVAATPIADAIKTTVAWYRAHPKG
jgi:hypothetical protein